MPAVGSAGLTTIRGLKGGKILLSVNVFQRRFMGGTCAQCRASCLALGFCWPGSKQNNAIY